jgi:predicted DNA-binding protein with PD1-like motif
MEAGEESPNHPGEQVLLVQAGQELLAEVESYACQHDIQDARFSVHGAFDSCVVGLFDFSQARYIDVTMEGPVAIVSLAGHITCRKGKVAAGAHGVFAAPGGNCHAGQLRSAIVRAKLVVSIGGSNRSAKGKAPVA